MKYYIGKQTVPKSLIDEFDDVLVETTQLIDFTQLKRYFVVSGNITESRKTMLNNLLKYEGKMEEKNSIEDCKCFIGNKDGVDIKNENPNSYIAIPFSEYKELLITKGKYEELKGINNIKNI